MQQSGFSPKARWDRRIPIDESSGCDDFLNEKIDVLALFKSGKVYPKAFYWQDKLYKVCKLTYAWQERRGAEIINHFSVQTQANLYQLSFNSNTLSWRLNRILE